METLAQLIKDAVITTLVDIQKKANSIVFKIGLERYLTILKPSIDRYEHHQGNDVSMEELRKRYEYETALLHVFTNIFAFNLAEEISITWPVNQPDSPYNWYEIPTDLSISVEEIVLELSKLDSPALTMSQLGGQILDKASKRYLGEFYTPLPIAEYLIEQSGIHPKELFEGKRIIDPACGGGIILVSIAQKSISYAIKQNYSPEHILQCLSQNLFGFDIQPFAHFITKSLLIYGCLPLLVQIGRSPLSHPFPNIKLQDTLITYDLYWPETERLFQYLTREKRFHYIIGNPPFMSAKGSLLGYLEHYAEVLYGHPNLYQLFLWWAVRATVQDGVISFLLPQSMLAGSYFKELREQLDKETNIISITRMIDRKGVVGDADLQMMVLCLKVSKDKAAREHGINVRITRNGSDILHSALYKAKYPQIVHKIKETPMYWVVSDEDADYQICDRLESKCVRLGELTELFVSGNGSFVWNQHKELLREREEKNTLPLISAASIDLYGFTFPYSGSHPSRVRSFSIVGETILHKIHSQIALLIQRTTPRKVGRRLVAGIPPSEFFNKYPQYFLENHVNYIKVVNGTDTQILYGLLGWLNSDLINFVFQLRNGTTLVSIYELSLLPVTLEVVKQLVPLTQNIITTTGKERVINIKALNEAIFDWLELEPRYRDRIESVLNRREIEDANARR